MLKDFTFWETLKVGGPVMVLLVLCSIVSVAIILEHLKQGDDKKALRACKEAAMPFASVVGAGLEAFPLDEKEIVEAMERETIIEINNFVKQCFCPLFYFLKTVLISLSIFPFFQFPLPAFVYIFRLLNTVFKRSHGL